MDIIEKYFAFSEGEYLDGMDYDEFESAFSVCEQLGGDEVQQHIWNSYEAWSDCLPADDAISVWKYERRQQQ